MYYTLIDTYPFLRGKLSGDRSIDELISIWEKYMSRFPDLFKLQVESYGESGADWREIAKEVVFTKLTDNLLFIEEAWLNLREAIPRAYAKFTGYWGTSLEVIFVVYVGIGCGAGWATEYQGRYAVLLGLESIAELRWHEMDDLEGLISHELAHIAHMLARGLRPKEFEKLEEDPLFLLYSEGFAMRCEHIVLGCEKWRVATDEKWLEQCKKQVSKLSSEYLRRVKAHEPVNEFFGHWLQVRGLSQTGYFLGHELVKSLEAGMDLKDAAKLPVEKVRKLSLCFLQRAQGQSQIGSR